MRRRNRVRRDLLEVQQQICLELLSRRGGIGAGLRFLENEMPEDLAGFGITAGIEIDEADGIGDLEPDRLIFGRRLRMGREVWEEDGRDCDQRRSSAVAP
jgi:hypothetical protein